MSFTYNRKLLLVNLTTGEIGQRELPDALYRKYLGGSGLAAGLLETDQSPLDVDPLGPDNTLFVVAGLLTGTPVPTACKTSFCARSPLTRLWSESTVGGHFGARLKATGYDGLVLSGQSRQPVYLCLDGEKTALLPATGLWGLDTYATDEAIRAQHPRAVIAAIGPAGEKRLPIASVMIGGWEGRAAGRTGMGAVMGSKGLKAIAVSASGVPTLHDRAGLLANVKALLPGILENTTGLQNYGTSAITLGAEKSGDLPIHNWMDGSWTEQVAKVSGPRIRETIYRKDYACFACPIHCGKEVEATRGLSAGHIVHTTEYETVAGFGPLCLNDDLESIVVCGDLCNRYGLDTISTSSVIAFALECFEQGLLTEQDTGGLKLNWGNAQVLETLVDQIGRQEGLGVLLGEGVRGAARTLGRGSAAFAVEVKGLEMAYHDPRAFTSMVANYASANRGACHLEGMSFFTETGAFPGKHLGFSKEFDTHGVENKAEITILMQDYLAVFNSLGLCKFLLRGQITPDHLAHWINLAAGWEITGDAVLRTGESLFNLHRRQNVRLGINRQDDVLPQRLLTQARPTGGAAGVLPNLEQIIVDYYTLRGWDEHGVPTGV